MKELYEQSSLQPRKLKLSVVELRTENETSIFEYNLYKKVMMGTWIAF
jgi:hypothetical protein